MKRETTNHRSGSLSFQPVVRYLILFYVLIILMEMLVGGGFAFQNMKKEADFVNSSTQRQIEYRVSQTVRLLNSLAADPYYSDPAISYHDKAVKLTQYSQMFEYMMICIVDKDMNVWDETNVPASLAKRAYMQRLFATGETQVTDCFAAGADGKTLNYTIATPIMKNGAVDGCIFAAIYFDELEKTTKANAYSSYQEIGLFGSASQAMNTPNPLEYGKSYLELEKDAVLFGTTAKQVEENMYNDTDGHYWSFEKGNFYYTNYLNVKGTQWMLFCRIGFFNILMQNLPQMIVMFLGTTLLCIAMVLLTKRFIRSQMGTVDMLVESVQELEKKIYQNEKPDNVDFKEIISLTSKGLTDSLTGVITRTVFLNQIPSKLKTIKENEIAALCFIDIDNLKILNDNYGHGIGDIALKNVGYVLREYEKKHDGLVGRHGGDEFILWMTGFVARDELEDTLEELVRRLHFDIVNGEETIHAQCSVGVAICGKADEPAEQLIAHADEALYFVKQNGKGRYQIYGAPTNQMDAATESKTI